MKLHIVTIEPEDMKKHEVTITAGYAFCHRYHWRVKIGMFLIKMAGFISSFGVKEEIEDE